MESRLSLNHVKVQNRHTSDRFRKSLISSLVISLIIFANFEFFNHDKPSVIPNHNYHDNYLITEIRLRMILSSKKEDI